MKIKKIITKLNVTKIKQHSWGAVPAKRGDKVSLVFCDLTSGVSKIRYLRGNCVRLKSSGLGSMLKITSELKSTPFTLLTPLHSPQIVDLFKA